ncbi:MAG: hypothetical protein JSV82_03105, partial [Planctomycetota bacterium]
MLRRISFVYLVLVLMLSSKSIAQTILFSDGFESGDFAAGGWVTQNDDASAAFGAAYTDDYGAKLVKTTWIEKSIDTSDYSDIHLKYYRKTRNLDTNEYLYAEWYDGNDWNELESTNTKSWEDYQDKTCGSGADDNSSFKIRFRINANLNNECALLDDVEVTGTSTVPTPGVTIVESGGSTDVDEEGPTSDTYTVVLDSQPTSTVTITVDPDVETEVNNNGAGNPFDLTFLTTNWSSLQTVTVKAIDDANEEGNHTSIITHSAVSSDNDYNGINIDDVVANVKDNDSPTTDDVANSDIVVSGTVSGSYINTHNSDDSYESIQEILTTTSPRKNQYSYLVHKWTIDVTGGSTVTFYLEAHHTSNNEGDNFSFAYSTDDSNYTNMLTVTKTADDDANQSYELPSDTNGTLYIRVMDTDQSAGNQTLDTVYIDHMYVRSQQEAIPPGQASNPDPADDENNVSISTDLSWTPGSNTLSHDVYFGTNFNNVNDANTTITLGVFKGNQDTNTYDPCTLSYNTTYYWRIDERNTYGTTKGNVWSFTTVDNPDSDGDGIPDFWENQYGLDPNDPGDADLDLDTDNYNNLSEFLHNSEPNNPESVPLDNITIAVPTQVNAIQRAINASIDGDIITIAQDTYYETINFAGKSIHLRSTDPNDPNVVASTIIDANNISVDAVVFNSDEDANSILDGITITGGRYGIYCYNYSSPKILNCTISGNQSYGLYCSYIGSPIVSGC